MIEDAYRSTGNSLGWRLLASPEATLDDAEVAFEHGALVVLPHLSRFPIMTRSKSQRALSDLFGARWQA